MNMNKTEIAKKYAILSTGFSGNLALKTFTLI